MSSFEQLATTASWFAVAPELFLLITAFVVLGYDMAASPQKKDVHGFFVALGIGLAMVTVFEQYRRAVDGVLGSVTSFSGMLRLDGTSILTSGALLVWAATKISSLPGRDSARTQLASSPRLRPGTV